MSGTDMNLTQNEKDMVNLAFAALAMVSHPCPSAMAILETKCMAMTLMDKLGPEEYLKIQVKLVSKLIPETKEKNDAFLLEQEKAFALLREILKQEAAAPTN